MAALGGETNNGIIGALAALAVREIERADGGNPHEHQDGGEQDDYNQGSLLVLPTLGASQSPCSNSLTFQ